MSGSMVNLRFVSVMTCILVFMMLMASAVRANTPAQVFAQASPSIVVVDIINDKGNPIGLGSGVVIGEGQVITNCHVTKTSKNIQVRQSGRTYKAALQFSDYDRDLCQLSVPTLQAPSIAFGTAKNLVVGQRVYAIGAPQGLELTLSEGLISSLRSYEGSLYIQTSAAISAGSSGGGLFDEQGRLIGITTYYSFAGQNLNFALPVEWITELPRRAKISPVSEKEAGINWLNRAVVMEKEKDWTGLFELSQLWIKSEPENVAAWIILGEAYEGSKQHNEAIQAYREALRIQPDNAIAWHGLGTVYDEGLKQYDEAIRSYQEALRIQPKFASAWSGLGLVYSRGLKQYSEAIQAFREALRIQTKDVRAWYNLGLAYYQLEQYDQSSQALQEALRLNPEYFEAWNNLGAAYDGLKQHDEAIRAYGEAVRIRTDDAMAWSNLGMAYFKLAQYDQAIHAFRKALVVDPESVDILYSLGATYYFQGQHKANRASTMEIYNSLRKLNPAISDKFYKAFLSPYNSVNTVENENISEAVEQRNWRKVIKLSGEMTKANPEDFMAWHNMGHAYEQLDLNSKASEAYREAVRIEPGFVEAWQALGTVYVKLKRYDEASQAYGESRRLRGKQIAH